MLFLPMQQELDCISDSGRILGKIRFNYAKNGHHFYPDSESIALSSLEECQIAQRLAGLDSGACSIPMPDDD